MDGEALGNARRLAHYASDFKSTTGTDYAFASKDLHSIAIQKKSILKGRQLIQQPRWQVIDVSYYITALRSSLNISKVFSCCLLRASFGRSTLVGSQDPRLMDAHSKLAVKSTERSRGNILKVRKTIFLGSEDGHETALLLEHYFGTGQHMAILYLFGFILAILELHPEASRRHSERFGLPPPP